MWLGDAGKQVLYQATKLTQVDDADIAQVAVAGQHNGVQRPIIDINCNNFIHVASCNVMDPVSLVPMGLCLQDLSAEPATAASLGKVTPSVYYDMSILILHLWPQR